MPESHGLHKQIIRNAIAAGRNNSASAVEYGLLVGLIAVAIIGAVTALGTSIQTAFNDAASAISYGK
jgi:pilus assembly protein Flp/PilA